jgi:hypothetical protein
MLLFYMIRRALREFVCGFGSTFKIGELTFPPGKVAGQETLAAASIVPAVDGARNGRCPASSRRLPVVPRSQISS